jgi:mono/diheme cytochrome c family protein
MLAAAFVLFWVILGLAVVLAAMRSNSRPLFDPASRHARRTVYVLVGAAVALFGVAVPVVAGTFGGSQADRGPSGIELTAQEQRGRSLFADKCKQCHTLSAANAVGRVGPSLDDLRPPKALVIDAIAKGRARGQGQMPANLVRGQEAEDVAAFVARVAGR